MLICTTIKFIVAKISTIFYKKLKQELIYEPFVYSLHPGYVSHKLLNSNEVFLSLYTFAGETWISNRNLNKLLVTEGFRAIVPCVILILTKCVNVYVCVCVSCFTSNVLHRVSCVHRAKPKGLLITTRASRSQINSKLQPKAPIHGNDRSGDVVWKLRRSYVPKCCISWTRNSCHQAEHFELVLTLDLIFLCNT